jgi:hypothetical protein
MSETMKRFLHATMPLTSKGELVVLPPPIEDETLEELTANICKGHEAIESTLSTAALTAVEKGIENGKRLIRAKKLAGHGNFEDHCAQHFPFTMKTVQNYIRLAKSEAKLRQRLEEKRTAGSFLRMKDALEFIDAVQGKRKSKR